MPKVTAIKCEFGIPQGKCKLLGHIPEGFPEEVLPPLGCAEMGICPVERRRRVLQTKETPEQRVPSPEGGPCLPFSGALAGWAQGQDKAQARTQGLCWNTDYA